MKQVAPEALSDAPIAGESRGGGAISRRASAGVEALPSSAGNSFAVLPWEASLYLLSLLLELRMRGQRQVGYGRDGNPTGAQNWPLHAPRGNTCARNHGGGGRASEGCGLPVREGALAGNISPSYRAGGLGIRDSAPIALPMAFRGKAIAWTSTRSCAIPSASSRSCPLKDNFANWEA